MAFSPEYVRRLAASEYTRINRDLYNGGLPRWGSFGFRVTSGTTRVGGVKSLMNFPITMTISRQRDTLEALLDTIRHETAHIAQDTYERIQGIKDHGHHGPEWRFHAKVCGVSPEKIASYNHGGRVPRLLEQRY